MTEPIATLIVDDEPLARRKLRKLVEADPELHLAGEAANADEAIAAINAFDPRLIFLDIKMPRRSGFDVLAAINPERMPLVIFVTAFEEFAVRAFEVHAIDYLLKPYTATRFADAVKTAKSRLHDELNEKLAERTLALLSEVKTGYANRLMVKTRDAIVLLNSRDIDWVEAQDKYVRIHAGPEAHVMRETISSLEARLDPKRFIRIHRSHLVNLDRIRKLEPLINQEYQVVLRDGTKLVMSRGQRKRLADLLETGI
jgi:two-component system LytT family response regulator